MRYAIASAAIIGAAAASWSPDAGSHGPGGSWGPPAGAAPPSNGTWGGDSYTTEVVTALTTYCPYATEITHGGVTYTATEATTLTITNCEGGCTVTKPVTSAPPMTTTWETSVPETTPATSIPPPVTSAVVPPPPVYPTGNGTTVAPPATGTGVSTPSGTSGSPIEQTDNGAARPAAIGVGFLAALGLVAAL